MGLRNTASERKSTLNDLLLVVLSGGGFTLRDSLNTGPSCLFLPGERSAGQKLLTTETFLCRDHDVPEQQILQLVEEVDRLQAQLRDSEQVPP